MESVDFTNMRRAMVDSQLRTNGITSSWVVAAMGEVARENFVPHSLRSNAYTDRGLPLGGGRTLNPPLATALMLQTADVRPDDKVLLVGTGDGYLATLLAKRTANVVAVEAETEAPAGGDFSLMIIDGAVDELPERLLGAAREGARIVTGIVDGGVTRLVSGIVRGGQVSLRPFADTEIAPLPGFARSREFVF